MGARCQAAGGYDDIMAKISATKIPESTFKNFSLPAKVDSEGDFQGGHDIADIILDFHKTI